MATVLSVLNKGSLASPNPRCCFAALPSIAHSVFAHRQVMITLLQHTHKSLPHYDDKEWDWLRGALCTVDRSFGQFLNVMHHHIADTHVAHHLFSQVRRVPFTLIYFIAEFQFSTSLWQAGHGVDNEHPFSEMLSLGNHRNKLQCLHKDGFTIMEACA